MSKSKIVLSCDDGCSSDIKVAELAKKNGLQCTFYWPVEWHSLAYENNYQPLNFEQASIIANDFEIGSHSVTHRHLTRIPEKEAVNEIIESRYLLMTLFNQPIRKFCPPRGYTNKELTQAVVNASYDSQRLTKGVDAQGYNLVHVHPNSGANNNRRWQDVALEHEYVHLWMHSWELDKFDMWKELEGFLYDPLS